MPQGLGSRLSCPGRAIGHLEIFAGDSACRSGDLRPLYTTGEHRRASLGAIVGVTPTPRSHASPEATGALPTPQSPRYRAPAREASVFPAPVARGVREQPPDAPRLWEGKGQGLGGVRGAGWAAAARALCPATVSREWRAAARVGSCPLSTGVLLTGLRGRHRSPADPNSAGTHRFLSHCLLDARATAPRSSRSAAEGWGTNSPSSSRDRRSPRRNPDLPRGCKVVGSPDWLAASSRFASGTGQVAGVWEEGAGSCRPPTWVPESGGQDTAGMAAGHPPSSATPPSAPGGGALATGSALRTCPPHLRPPRPPSPQGGLWRPALLQPWFQLGDRDSALMQKLQPYPDLPSSPLPAYDPSLLSARTKPCV